MRYLSTEYLPERRTEDTGKGLVSQYIQVMRETGEETEISFPKGDTSPTIGSITRGIFLFIYLFPLAIHLTRVLFSYLFARG